MTYCNILVFSDFRTATVFKHEGTNKLDWWNKLKTLLQWRRSIIPAGCLRSTLFLLGSLVQQSISVRRLLNHCLHVSGKMLHLRPLWIKLIAFYWLKTQNSFHPNTNTQPWSLWESQGPHSLIHHLITSRAVFKQRGSLWPSGPELKSGRSSRNEFLNEAVDIFPEPIRLFTPI